MTHLLYQNFFFEGVNFWGEVTYLLHQNIFSVVHPSFCPHNTYFRSYRPLTLCPCLVCM